VTTIRKLVLKANTLKWPNFGEGDQGQSFFEVIDYRVSFKNIDKLKANKQKRIDEKREGVYQKKRQRKCSP